MLALEGLTLIEAGLPRWLTPVYVGLVVGGQIAWGGRFLYGGRYRVATREELLALARTVGLAAAGGAVFAIAAAVATGHARDGVAIAVLTPLLALALMLLSRLLWRARLEARRSRDPQALDALVYGAGEAGEQLLRLLRSPDAPYRAVGLIDDDPAKRNLRLSGVPVVGTGKDLDDLVVRRGVSTVILAMGRPDRALVAELTQKFAGTDVRLRVLPPVAQIVNGQVRLSDVRDVDVTDILGRRPIDTDVAAIADYLAGRRVLVTGAGGSIGSELARQLHHLGPESLILLDRDESALHSVQLDIYGQGLLDTPDMVLADIRDPEALEQVFARHRPHVVFHAAALKHLPMLEQYPAEGWKTNVMGTAALLDLATKHGVERFVNVSTDKAADPTSILGRSKLLAERLTAAAAERTGKPYLSVRFGNVLGSRGSMLVTFTRQIERGGPVTVTDPEVTRYFMTIPEACELVIQAAAIGRGGEVLVLDMGEPVRIVDVARLLISQSGQDIAIEYTGLRPGEKMHEDLFSTTEDGQRPFHPLISHVRATPIDGVELAAQRREWPADSSAAGVVSP